MRKFEEFSLRVTRRLIISALAFLLTTASASCLRQPSTRTNPETARRELALRGIEYKESELVSSAGEGDVWAVRLFLAAGMSPDSKDARGYTPLATAMSKGQKAVAKILLEHNANPNVLDRDGRPPIIRAVKLHDIELVKTLLDHRADVNLPGVDNFTALVYALESDEDIAQLLLARGADVTIKDASGGTALSWAVFYQRPVVVEALLAKGADANTVNKVGGTPLMIAAKGNAELVRLLLAHGAKTTLKDANGKTARQWALDSRQTEVAELIK